MEQKKLCKCEDCGKSFEYGTEGDNELFCLRCEHLSLTENMDELDRDYYDEMNERD